jgi:hypothetical protein
MHIVQAGAGRLRERQTLHSQGSQEVSIFFTPVITMNPPFKAFLMYRLIPDFHVEITNTENRFLEIQCLQK